eukprot:jgi/Hompol1/1722/HPOL_004794-RA
MTSLQQYAQHRQQHLGAGHGAGYGGLFEWWSVWYVWDYVVAAVLVALWAWAETLSPFERPVDPTAPDQRHPIYPYGNIISSTMLLVISLLVPLLAAALVYAAMLVLPSPATVPRPALLRFTARDAHAFIVGLILAVSLTGLFTDCTKAWAGRLRPDFLDRCQYNATLAACTGDPNVIKEGRRSFPSGHASESFAGMTFLAWFLASVWSRYWDLSSQWATHTRVWRITLSVIPLLLSIYVAITRTQQYVHFATDVIAGSLIGIFFATVVHWTYIVS